MRLSNHLTRLRSGVGLLSTLVLAGIALALVDMSQHELAAWFPADSQAAGEVWRVKLFESGPIPYAIMFVGLFGVVYALRYERRMLRPIRRDRSREQDVIDFAREGDIKALVERLRQRVGEANEASNTLARLREEGWRASFGRESDRMLNAFQSHQRNRPGYYTCCLLELAERHDIDGDLPAVLALKKDVLEEDEDAMVVGLAPLVWAEWSLPLLGFLGTVLGIADAIGGIEGGVAELFEAGALSASVREAFSEGFAGLSLAFDTTFFGLAFLITVGGFHFYLKRGAARTLAHVRETLNHTVSQWQTSGGKMIVESLRQLDLKLSAGVAMLSPRAARITELLEAVDGSIRDEIVTLVKRIEEGQVAASRGIEAIERSARGDLMSLMRRIETIQAAAGRSIEALESHALDARTHRHQVQRITEYTIAEAAPLGWLREVLFKPVVQFDSAGETLMKQVAALFGRTSGEGWQLEALGAGASGPSVMLAARVTVEGSRRSGLCFVNSENQLFDDRRFEACFEHEVSALVGVPGHAIGVAALRDGTVHRVGFGGAGASSPLNSVSRVEGLTVSEAGDAVFGLSLEARPYVAVARLSSQPPFLEAVGLDGGTAAQLDLPGDVAWREAVAAGSRGALIGVGRVESVRGARRSRFKGGWCLQWWRLEGAADDMDDREGAAAGGRVEWTEATRLDLSDDIEPRLVLPVGAGEVVIVDRAGRLHHWHVDRRVPLDVTPPKGWPGAIERVVGGRDGWFAVATRGKLSMWHVRPGGSVYPGGDALAITGLAVETLTASSNGRYLYGLADDRRALLTWRFPAFPIG